MRRRWPGAGAWMLGAALGAGSSSSSLAQGWQLVEPMPTARSYHASGTVGNRWYVAGGSFFDGNGEEFPTEVDVYDPTSNHWAVLGQLAQPRENLEAVVDPLRARVLFTGGVLPGGPNGASLPMPTCDLVEPDGVHSAPDLLIGRYGHAGSLVAGKFIVGGGEGPNGLLAEAEVWDGAAGAWTPAGEMRLGPREDFTMTTLENGWQVVAVGGTMGT